MGKAIDVYEVGDFLALLPFERPFFSGKEGDQFRDCIYVLAKRRAALLLFTILTLALFLIYDLEGGIAALNLTG